MNMLTLLIIGRLLTLNRQLDYMVRKRSLQNDGNVILNWLQELKERVPAGR